MNPMPIDTAPRDETPILVWDGDLWVMARFIGGGRPCTFRDWRWLTIGEWVRAIMKAEKGAPF